LPALPEIVLVIGAMLLLNGRPRFRGERATNGIDGTAILLLNRQPASSWYGCPATSSSPFGGQLRGRWLRALPQASGTHRLGGGDPHVVQFFLASRKKQKFEYSILILLSTVGMMMLISAARPDRALSRA